MQIFMNFFSLLTQNCVAGIAVCVHRTTFACPERTLAKNNGHNTKKTADFLCHQICSYYFCDNNLYYIVIN